MELSVTPNPPEWASQQGISYETRFLYTGLGRINTHAKTFQTFQTGPPLLFFERPFTGGVVSRVYSAEYVTVTEFSKSPRRWKEEAPDSTHYFAEIPR
jgi:hypothetical protein